MEPHPRPPPRYAEVVAPIHSVVTPEDPSTAVTEPAEAVHELEAKGELGDVARPLPVPTAVTWVAHAEGEPGASKLPSAPWILDGVPVAATIEDSEVVPIAPVLDDAGSTDPQHAGTGPRPAADGPPREPHELSRHSALLWLPEMAYRVLADARFKWAVLLWLCAFLLCGAASSASCGGDGNDGVVCVVSLRALAVFIMCPELLVAALLVASYSLCMASIVGVDVFGSLQELHEREMREREMREREEHEASGVAEGAAVGDSGPGTAGVPGGCAELWFACARRSPTHRRLIDGFVLCILAPAVFAFVPLAAGAVSPSLLGGSRAGTAVVACGVVLGAAAIAWAAQRYRRCCEGYAYVLLDDARGASRGPA